MVIPPPVYCASCETCNPVPQGPDMLGIGMSGWSYPAGNPSATLSPCFNPRNADEVAYDKITNSRFDGLWVTNLRTRQQRQIVPATARWAGQKRWSTTGWLSATDVIQDIWKVKANGDSLTQLTFTHAYSTPQWSPDGLRLASAVSTAAGRSVAILDSGGTLLQRLVLPNAYAEPLAWSPDGTRLLLSLAQSPNPGPGAVPAGFYLYHFATGQTTLLFNATTQQIQGAFSKGFDWTPDNRALIWASSIGLYRIDAQTGAGTLLRKNCESRTYAYPSVSADGRTILVERTSYEVRGTPRNLHIDVDIYAMDIDGSNERKLVL